MPPRHDLKPDQTNAAAKPTEAKPTPKDPAPLLIQRALANPSSQTLTPEVVRVLRGAYGSAFVQRLMDRAEAHETPAAPITESLESFLAGIQTARAARPTTPIQAKLTVTPAGDQYEQEADAVAKQVVQQMNAPTPTATSVPPIGATQRQTPDEKDKLKLKRDPFTIQRDHEDDKKEVQMMRIQRQAGDMMGGLDVAPDVESRIQSARGGGSPITEGVRSKLEGAFGADFSGVRVHTDGASDALNQSVQARAFTTGRDIFFRQGEYNPGSSGGQELLAHELTHVVQQGSATPTRHTVQADRVQRLVIRIRDLNERFNPFSKNTIWDASKTLKDYPAFGQNAKWKQDIGIGQAVSGDQSRELDANEPLVVVSHGSEPTINNLKELKVSFGGFSPAELAAKVAPILPANYSGEIFLNGCYTGMRVGYAQAGTSFIEAFGAALLQAKPNYSGIIKGNIGAASTLSGAEELIGIDKATYDKMVEQRIGVATNKDSTKYYLRGPFGQARYKPADGTYNDLGYNRVITGN